VKTAAAAPSGLLGICEVSLPGAHAPGFMLLPTSGLSSGGLVQLFCDEPLCAAWGAGLGLLSTLCALAAQGERAGNAALSAPRSDANARALWPLRILELRPTKSRGTYHAVPTPRRALASASAARLSVSGYSSSLRATAVYLLRRTKEETRAAFPTALDTSSRERSRA
jgi:hypothetical protein